MKSGALKKTTLLFVFACLAGCHSKTEIDRTESQPVNKDSVRTAIAAMEARYAKGMETKNIDEVMAYYADDVKSFNEGGGQSQGAADLRKTMSELFTKLPNGIKIKMETDDIVVSADGSLVTENGRYTTADSTGNKIGSGYFLATFELRDGQYKCVREMVAEDKKLGGK